MKTKRILALLLSLIMVLGLCSIAFAADAEEEGVVVIAGSDFQSPDGDEGSQKCVASILEAIKKDHPKADGLVFCGDYDKHLWSRDVEASINALKETVGSYYGDDINYFLIQGNHDNVAQGTCGLTGPGGHDTDDYGVFIIDEDDYQWGFFVREARIKQTAANLKAYLDEKVEEGYQKPIFVGTHVGLQFNVRTATNGDARYGKYIFDVLNDAAEQGLNIIFLYGHDHSQGYGNYMGGSSIFFPVGDTLNVATPSNRRTYTEEKLNFTYMNAGFVAYYADFEPETDAENPDSGVDKTITMTVFTIYSDRVVVERYDANGLHNLKSEGKRDIKHEATEISLGYAIRDYIYPSPQFVPLFHVYAGKTIVDIAKEKSISVNVKYDGAPDSLTTVRLSIDSKIPITSIESNNDFEYNQEDGKIIIYSSDGTAIDNDLFTINYTFDELYPDGEYPIELRVLEATGLDAEDAPRGFIDGAIIVDNTYAKGDVTQDGEITNADLIMIARYLVDLVQFNEKQLEAADFNEDGNVTNADLVLIARYIVSKTDEIAA